jgi:hypothetical protein
MKINIILIGIILTFQGCVPQERFNSTPSKLEGTAYTTSRIDLKEKKNLSSKKIIVIEEGEEVLIINSSLSYCKVSHKGHFGYVSKKQLTKYRPSRPNQFAPSSQWYSPNTLSPPKTEECKTVQCSGTTLKGARCKNTTKNCTGRCHLH